MSGKYANSASHESGSRRRSSNLMDIRILPDCFGSDGRKEKWPEAHTGISKLQVQGKVEDRTHRQESGIAETS
jgi:hypothetical protein